MNRITNLMKIDMCSGKLETLSEIIISNLISGKYATYLFYTELISNLLNTCKNII